MTPPDHDEHGRSAPDVILEWRCRGCGSCDIRERHYRGCRFEPNDAYTQERPTVDDGLPGNAFSDGPYGA